MLRMKYIFVSLPIILAFVAFIFCEKNSLKLQSFKSHSFAAKYKLKAGVRISDECFYETLGHDANCSNNYAPPNGPSNETIQNKEWCCAMYQFYDCSLEVCMLSCLNRLFYYFNSMSGHRQRGLLY